MGERSVAGEGGEERQQWRRGLGKKKRRISTKEEERRGGGREMAGPRRMKEGKKEEEGEAEAGNLESTIHSNPGTTGGSTCSCTPLFAKICILLDLSRP